MSTVTGPATVFLNPAYSTATVYRPTFSGLARYSPSELVVVTNSVPRSTSSTLTVAADTTALLESLTVPVIPPVSFCAHVAQHKRMSSATAPIALLPLCASLFVLNSKLMLFGRPKKQCLLSCICGLLTQLTSRRFGRLAVYQYLGHVPLDLYVTICYYYFRFVKSQVELWSFARGNAPSS